MTGFICKHVKSKDQKVWINESRTAFYLGITDDFFSNFLSLALIPKQQGLLLSRTIALAIYSALPSLLLLSLPTDFHGF